MNDYHVFSLHTLQALEPDVTDHGIVLDLPSTPWASTQLWAPDAANNVHTKLYHLFFPARDKARIFRVGTACSPSPAGPFKADKEYLEGTYSIDPCSFVDDDDDEPGCAYLYFGGLWGGELQCWQTPGTFDASQSGLKEPSGFGVYALGPRVAKLSRDMNSVEEDPKEIQILAPETGKGILADDHDRRFFEAAWVHKYRGKYYLSYSTGDTHFIIYAVSDDPYGPFVYRGRILDPVVGWTTHHSIVEFEGRWWLFYHDSSLSGGKSHLRCVKVREIVYDADGNISLAQPQ